MKIKRTLTIITAVAALGFISYGIAAKVGATADYGYHILQSSPQYYIPPTYTTSNPSGCPGIVFPTPIPQPKQGQTTTSPSPSNRIGFTSQAQIGQWCSTTYRGTVGQQSGYHCTVSVKVKKVVGGVYEAKIKTSGPSCSYEEPNVILTSNS